jgi:chitinase
MALILGAEPAHFRAFRLSGIDQLWQVWLTRGAADGGQPREDTMRRSLFVAFALAVLAALLTSTGAYARSNDRVVGAYFASWDIYDRGYFPKQIPASKLTTLFYAFAAPAQDGTCGILDPWADYQRPYAAEQSVDGVPDDPANLDQHLFGNFNQLRKLKARNPGLQILISLGGFTQSTYFSDVAATPASRAKFVSSCIDTFIKGDLPGGSWPPGAGGQGAAAGVFDGIDVDWEYPGLDVGNQAHHSPADTHNATLLFREFRSQLDALGSQTGKHYLLTAALPAGNVNSQQFELADVSRTVDWINLLTFDFHGPWDRHTDFNSPFFIDPFEVFDAPPPASRTAFTTLGTVLLYIGKGVSPSKLVVGVPFYARQYVRVGTANHGLYQTFDNTGLDPNSLQWDRTPTPTYHDLIDNAGIVSRDGVGQNGYTRFWNPFTRVPWLFSPSASHAFASGAVVTPTFISYDDPRSLAERTRLVDQLHLRGVWAWEISQDDDAHDLVNAIAAG